MDVDQDMDVQTFTPGPSVQEAENRENVRKTVEALREISSTAQSLAEVVTGMTAKMQKGDFPTSSGLSFLELRNLLMLNYLKDLVSVAEVKSQGQSLQQDECKEAILRIVEMRTSLEKMRPIHFKLKYRIEKLVRAANTKSVDPADPINLRPNLQALDLEDETEAPENADKKQAGDELSKNKKYVVPKVSAVPYDDETGDAKRCKELERAKKRALSSNLMKELRSEFDDAPEEISEMTVGRKRMLKEVKERIRYEEDNFTRLNVQKEKRRKEESLLTIGDLGSTITKFDDVSALDQTVDDMRSDFRKKKRMSLKKNSGKKKKAGGKKFKRRK
jgi:U3 small nucleolar ribonucleoprotein protein LCP5